MRQQKLDASQRVFASSGPRLVLVKGKPYTAIADFVLHDLVRKLERGILLLDKFPQLPKTLKERNHRHVELSVHEHSAYW